MVGVYTFERLAQCHWLGGRPLYLVVFKITALFGATEIGSPKWLAPTAAQRRQLRVDHGRLAS